MTNIRQSIRRRRVKYIKSLFYLRRSRQVLEQWKLLLLLLLGWLLLCGGGADCMSPSTIPYFGTINSLRGGIHQKMAVSLPLTSAL